MTRPPVGAYAGRTPAYVKHLLLGTYSSALVHKIASRFNEIVYIDGYSGPWQSVDEKYEDTSFGIALAQMRSAKEVWANNGRNVRMRAFLVESRSSAFRQLQALPDRYPDIEVRPYQSEFVPLVPRLVSDIPSGAFTFVLIDPKGWKIDTAAIAPLLRRPNLEVLFTFMFDFINRAVGIKDGVIEEGLGALIPTADWRERLEAADGPSGRKAVLIGAFSDAIAQLGNYAYVAETPIFRAVADRTLYSLIYATRNPAGIEVFRSAQIKALRAQEKVRGAAKLAKNTQEEMFAAGEMTPSDVEAYLAAEREMARELLLDLTPPSPATTSWGDTWPRVLAKHAVTRTDLNRIGFALSKSGNLIFPDWQPGKRAPQDSWRFRSANH